MRLVVRVRVCVWVLGLLLAASPVAVADGAASAGDMAMARHVLDRLAMGGRPGDVERVAEMGWRAWVRQQLNPRSIDDAAMDAEVRRRYPSMSMTMGQVFANYRPERMGMATPEQERERFRLYQQVQRELRESVLHRAVKSERRFEEVMVDFWRNHFNVDQNKDDTGYVANHYEEQVIRRHAFGRFEDLLLATARHPAMLIYLDNIVSQRPLSEREERLVARYEGRDRVPRSVDALARHRGLNENYARELMELHTLGVDNGYTQRDVIELSRVLTGWSAGWTDGPGGPEYGFQFRREVHDDGPKALLGSQLRGREGEAEGVRVIRALAAHPKTAEHIAWKLCSYLVADDPPPALVQRVARVFRTTRGDLPRVYEAIVLSPEFADERYRATKFKTPLVFVVSSLRATGAEVSQWGGLLDSLAQMGQPIYGCEDPTGYDHRAEAWLDPGVLVYRWTFALRLASDNISGVVIPERYRSELALLSPHDLAGTLLRDFAATSRNPRHDRVLRESIVEAHDVSLALGLAVGSPAFQQK